MEDRPSDTVALPKALIAGGAVWEGARLRLVEDPQALCRGDYAQAALAGRDLSDLDLSQGDFFRADLDHANLKKARAEGADFSHARLGGAAFYKAQLAGAIFLEADLRGADLSASDCRGADLRGARLAGARLNGADLRGADLAEADLTDADLSEADITGARMRAANLSGARVTRLRYGGYRRMGGLYQGLRGLDQTHGNAIFVRDARDQDYIDTLDQALSDLPAGALRSFERLLFRLWASIDHGRSLLKVWLYAFSIATLYGLIYLADMILGWGIMDYSNSAQTWFTPFYYSVVTYTTLGYGDVTAASMLGEILVISEVIVGYFTLGLLLAILANTIARRS